MDYHCLYACGCTPDALPFAELEGLWKGPGLLDPNKGGLPQPTGP